MSRLDHKRGRKSNYVKSGVSSQAHVAARRLALERERFKCKICGSSHELEMHHISYHIRGKENENLRWVVMLCSTCHQHVHGNAEHEYNPCNPFKKAII